MVQNRIWIRRNQGNSSTKEITIKIDASCHVEIPIGIYLGKSSTASDISIIGADWVHPTLMRINSGRSQGMGIAAIQAHHSPIWSSEKVGFSQVWCQRAGGGEDRVSSLISPGLQRGWGGAASCPKPGSATGTVFRLLGTMEGTCSCQGSLPTAQPISRWSTSKGGISLARNGPKESIIPMPNVLHSHLCLVLLGTAPCYREGWLKVDKNTMGLQGKAKTRNVK